MKPDNLEYYRQVKKRTRRLLKMIPPDCIDFSYAPGKFTIADQVRHIAAMERNMFAETMARRQNRYAGCGPELAQGYDAVLAYYELCAEETLAILNSLEPESWNEKIVTPGEIQLVASRWFQLMIEHEIHHRAQLYVYLGLLEVKTPPIFGMTSEEVRDRSVG